MWIPIGVFDFCRIQIGKAGRGKKYPWLGFVGKIHGGFKEDPGFISQIDWFPEDVPLNPINHWPITINHEGPMAVEKKTSGNQKRQNPPLVDDFPRGFSIATFDDRGCP